MNEQHFHVADRKIIFNTTEYQITPFFFKLFLKGSRINANQLTDEEKEALTHFIAYAVGLGRDVKSNLYRVLNKITNYDPNEQSMADYELNRDEIEGTRNFKFLSSNPDFLVERLDVLDCEHFAGNTNAYREASAILHEILRMGELSNKKYENGMNTFIE